MKFIRYGEALSIPDDSKIGQINKKYGFEEINIGCVVTDPLMNAIENYNNGVNNYLIRRNGKNWRVKYKKEIDSLWANSTYY